MRINGWLVSSLESIRFFFLYSSHFLYVIVETIVVVVILLSIVTHITCLFDNNKSFQMPSIQWNSHFSYCFHIYLSSDFITFVSLSLSLCLFPFPCSFFFCYFFSHFNFSFLLTFMVLSMRLYLHINKIHTVTVYDNVTIQWLMCVNFVISFSMWKKNEKKNMKFVCISVCGCACL